MMSSEQNQGKLPPPPPPPNVTFGRQTASGRYRSYSREDLEGVDFSKYVVQFPVTPDNQPMDVVPLDPAVSDEAAEGCDGKVPAAKGGRRMRSMAGEFDYNQLLFETKGTYGYGNAIREEKDEAGDGEDQGKRKDFVGKPWRPLTRKLKIPAAVLSPYRLFATVLPTSCAPGNPQHPGDLARLRRPYDLARLDELAT